jgi:thiol:disulfide interchange protein DsbD
MRRLFAFVLLLGSMAVNCSAQGGADAGQITTQAWLSLDKLAPGARFQLAVVLQVNSPWHVNANPASGEGFIPTTLTLQPTASVIVDRIVYPKGEKTAVSWNDQPVDLYTGRTIIFVEAHVRPDAVPAPFKLEASLRYQACNDRLCFAPVTIPLIVDTEIVSSTQTPQPAHPEIFGSVVPAGMPSPTSARAENSIARLIRERGLVAALAFLFVSGLLLNLTPCVYPMITITVSYFGGQKEKKTARAFAGALAYFFGIVITYSAVGLAAALTGGLFGTLLQNPIVLLLIGLLLVAMALSMFGLFELQPPQFLMQRASSLSSKAGYVGLFFLGATVGVIAAPCLAPVVVVVLAFAGSSGDPWLGWWLFFALGVGLGLPYIVLGTFSSLLTRLPKSGAWMVWVKRVFGTALIGVALWITNPLWMPASATQGGGIAWQPYLPAALQQAAAEKRPVLIDFYADWCIPCKEMDKKTYPDQRVVEKAREFLMLKADLTHTGSPEVDELTRNYKILGVPTAVFIGPEGQERAELRKIGFVPVDEFLDAMTKALAPAAAATNVPAASTSSAPNVPPQLLRPF